jgi:hypothetical protein
MKSSESSNNFYCKICNYSTSRKSQYRRHLLTAKHQILTNPNKKVPLDNFNICECGKAYKHLSSLCAHKKLCTIINSKPGLVENNSDYIPSTQLINEGTGGVIELIKQNQEFKDLLVEQQKTNQSLQKQLIEVIKDNKTINNTTNNNQKFNLNFFLNTTCKDAMNMSEFIENIEADFKDIENIGRNGYVSGMTDMIVSRIKELDITKRPLHCTDLKRETMYIKDNNEWYKDTPENSKLHKMINCVAERNYAVVPLWKEKHPESSNWDHPQYEFCIDMMKNVLGDIGNEQTRLDNKVIRKLSRHILVDKDQLV